MKLEANSFKSWRTSQIGGQSYSSVIMSKMNSSEDKVRSRRNLLVAAVSLGALVLAGGVIAASRVLTRSNNGTSETSTTSQTTSSSSTQQSLSDFPVVLVANVSNLEVGIPITFNYPLDETPNILVKLGEHAQGGVGPDGDIVAFSQICQHLGCIYGFVAANESPNCEVSNSFEASKPVGYCCCHGSIYDLANGGEVIGGPAPRHVPQVLLNFDSSTGNIYATGMTPPTIYGHDTGSNDVSNDLQGGTIVS